jgi:hypothetical protein
MNGMRSPVRSRGWKSPSSWARGFLGVALAGVLVYAANVVLDEVDPSNGWGLAYGGAATAFLVGAALIGVRRRTMRTGVGRSRAWQQFHLYGGALFFLFVLLHTGFRIPEGQMSWWLFFLSLWVFLSGLLGVLVQAWLPRALTSGLRVEAVYERIPELVADLRQRAEELAGKGPAPVRDFHRRTLAPLMAGPHPRAAYLWDVTSGTRALRDDFRFLRRMVPAPGHGLVDELEEVCAAKMELDAHYTLQKGLRYWMALHLPPSIALLVLVGLHIFAIIYW